MKILSVSDYVVPALYHEFDVERFTGVDLILSCGDLPPEYLSFLYATLDAPLYYVRGNHDIRYMSKLPDGCVDAHARLIQSNVLKILGLEGSMWYNGGPHQYAEGQMRGLILRLRPRVWLRGKPDIIITHAPPRHIHDAEDQCHKGFKCFQWLIERYAPAYFIHGHIHKNFADPSERITRVNQTKVINTYGYTLFDINEDKTAEMV